MSFQFLISYVFQKHDESKYRHGYGQIKINILMQPEASLKMLTSQNCLCVQVDTTILIRRYLITILAKYCCILSTKTNDLCFYNLLTRSELISCISSSTCSGFLIKLVYFLSLYRLRTFTSHLSKHFHFLIIIRIYVSTPNLYI